MRRTEKKDTCTQVSVHIADFSRSKSTMSLFSTSLASCSVLQNASLVPQTHNPSAPPYTSVSSTVGDIMYDLCGPARFSSYAKFPVGSVRLLCSAQNQYSGAKLLIRRKNSRGPDTWTSSRNECNWAGYTGKSTGTKLNSGRRKERKGSWEPWSRPSALSWAQINLHLHSIYAGIQNLYSFNFKCFLLVAVRTTDLQPKCLPHIIFPLLPYPLLKDCTGKQRGSIRLFWPEIPSLINHLQGLLTSAAMLQKEGTNSGARCCTKY